MLLLISDFEEEKVIPGRVGMRGLRNSTGASAQGNGAPEFCSAASFSVDCWLMQRKSSNFTEVEHSEVRGRRDHQIFLGPSEEILEGRSQSSEE